MKKINLILQSITLMMLFQIAVLGWDPPIGIPRPEFGIEETYRMYDDPANRNPALTYTQNAEGGYYTHYVDFTDPNATDVNNEFGSPQKPRQHLPSRVNEIPPGSVVEVHGPYPTGDSTTYVKGYASASYPIFVRGIDYPLFNSALRVEGTHIILEGMRTKTCLVMPEYAGERDTEYVAVRDCNVYTTDNSAGGVRVGAYLETDPSVRNAVIYDVIAHDFGHMDIPTDEDATAIAIGSWNASYIWILDCTCYTASGVGILVCCHNTDHTFLGRNEIYNVRQAGIWLKYGNSVVMSQNKIHDMVSYNGQAAGLGHQYLPSTDLWYICNEAYHVDYGVQGVGGTADSHVYIIGNVFHDVGPVRDRNGLDINVNGAAIISYVPGHRYIIGNTAYDVPSGFHLSGMGNYTIANNIIMDINDANDTCEHIDIDENTAVDSNCENNLFYQTGGSIVLDWGNLTTGDMDVLRSKTSTGEGCIVGDPQFTNSFTKDFHLQSTSPAIDSGISSGVVQEVFDKFYQLYGIDIRKDIDGGVRPYGAGWDIGAYEWGSTPTEPPKPPEPPQPPEPPVSPQAFPEKTELNCYNNVINPKKGEEAIIHIELEKQAYVQVIIYDNKGKKIKTIIDENKEPGFYSLLWNGKNDAGTTVGSGIYIVHMKTGSYSETKKIAVIK